MSRKYPGSTNEAPHSRPLRKCNAPVKRPLVPLVPLDPLVLPIPRKPPAFPSREAPLSPHRFAPLAKPSSRPTGSPLSRSPALSPYCAAVGFGADGLTSGNIVGYTQVPRYQTFTFAGSMFAKPGMSYYLLNEVNLDGAATTGGDFIQFFKPGTTTLDRDQAFFFDGDDWCYKYDASSSTVGDWEAEDPIPENFQVPCNIGFITRFTSAKSASSIITYSGEVQQGDGAEVKVDRVSAYQIVVNPLPRNVDLTELTVESAATTGGDFIQFFKPGTTTLDRDQAFFFDGDDWCYKYDATSAEVGDWESEDAVPAGKCVIKPGEGFLIRFTSAKAENAKIVFPSPVAAVN